MDNSIQTFKDEAASSATVTLAACMSHSDSFRLLSDALGIFETEVPVVTKGHSCRMALLTESDHCLFTALSTS